MPCELMSKPTLVPKLVAMHSFYGGEKRDPIYGHEAGPGFPVPIPVCFPLSTLLT